MPNVLSTFCKDFRMKLPDTIQLVREAFAGQSDRGGVPMFQHMQRVADLVKDEDETTQHIAWLHDILEDTHFRIDHYPVEIREAVELLTRPKKMPYGDYIDRLIASGNRRAILVKLADNMDNCDPHRMMQLDRHVRLALTKRYSGVRERLIEALL
jgi:(p)ppGpp synthase/HD superfamily hydrolase